MPEALTPIERRIYNFVIDHLKKETYQPSVREIGSRFGIRSTKTVTEHLQALQRKGYLDRTPARSRALRILGLDLSPDTYTIPVYPQGGVPGELPESSLDLDRAVACSADCYFVRVSGDHLRGQGVVDGDLILVEPISALGPDELGVVDRNGRIEFEESLEESEVRASASAGDGAVGRDGSSAFASRSFLHDSVPDGHGSIGAERFLGVARALVRRFP